MRLFISHLKNKKKKKTLLESDSAECLDEGLEGCELLLIDEAELVDKVYEVLEGGVEVGLLAKADDALEVAVVDVGVHAEQPLEDVLHDLLERRGERDADLGREDGLVVQLALHPRHQEVHVLGRAHSNSLLDGLPVGPVILIPIKENIKGIN